MMSASNCSATLFVLTLNEPLACVRSKARRNCWNAPGGGTRVPDRRALGGAKSRGPQKRGSALRSLSMLGRVHRSAFDAQ